MHCPRCGTANLDTAQFCASCGQTLRPGAEPPRRDEGVGLLGIVLFCLPIVGAIMYFVWKNDHPKKSQTACYLALAGMAVGIVLQILVTMMDLAVS